MTTLPRPAIAPAPAWTFPAAERAALANGAEVAVYPLPGQYVASVGVLLDAPLSSEPAGREGVATVTSAALIEGTADHPGGSFAEAIEDEGAVLGGGVDFSTTQVLLDVPVSHLTRALPLLAEAVISPALTDAAVARHAAQLAAGLDQQLATGPGIAARALRAALLDPASRESRPRSGDPASVRALTGADARAHHARTAGPRGALIVVAGDVAPSVLADVEAAFGSWANPAQVTGEHTRPRSARPAAIIIDRPGAVQADLRLGWATIDRSDPRWTDLQIATNALGGAYLSRLNKVLREERGFTYGISLVNGPMRHGGLSYAQGAFRTEVVGDALALARELLTLDAAPITPDEVARARDYLTGTTPLRFATAAGVTGGVLSLAGAGLPASFVAEQVAGYARATPERATAVAAELLDPDAATLVLVGDADALVDQVSRAGYDAEVRPAP
ncbi:insulinase family protein [Propioniciclava coleopterorum]|uniref:Insulinase family protein n=1 Tax=Propioniciclava coleopterorum TaxID=2714937 RepID=A0A6G7Y921_9ACTN|nr:pitrilysin family protein [Propioniciclava coleopterorum]QIK73293.1 insulinase family protein [Propioniciclava coleopterorum]